MAAQRAFGDETADAITYLALVSSSLLLISYNERF
jgi:hypothetical protein